jgi:hypothetical protein
MWFRPEELSGADGSSLYLWHSAAGYTTLTQSDSTRYPILKTGSNGINGNTVVRFDGTNDYLGCVQVLGAAAGITVMFVVRPLATVTAKGILSLGASATDGTPTILFQRDSTNVKVYINGSGYHWIIAHANNATHLYTLKLSGTTWTLELDGVDQGSPLTLGASGNNFILYVGTGFNGQANVDIPEIAIWNSGISTSLQSDATTYMKTKYGL